MVSPSSQLEAISCLSRSARSLRHIEILSESLKTSLPFNVREWIVYALSKNPSSWELIVLGFPCPNCTSPFQCTQPVNAAVTRDDFTFLEHLITDGFEIGPSFVKASSCYGALPLYFAVRDERIDMMRLLVQAGAEVDIKYHCLRLTPLQYTSQLGRLRLARVLLEAGADINARASFSYFEGGSSTALEAAARFGYLDIVHLLVANNTDTRKLKHDCRRAGRMARILYHNHIARFLEQRAAALQEKFGRDDMDDIIDGACDCLILRSFYHEQCMAAFEQPRNLYAFMIYYTNAIPDMDDYEPRLKSELTDQESLEEIGDLLTFPHAFFEKLRKRAWVPSWWLLNSDY